MRIAKLAGTLCMVAVACAPGMAWAQASAVGATVAFEADLAKAASTPRGVVKAGGVEWKCSTTHCSGRGPGGDPTASCKALVAQVGALKNFMAEGRAVDVKTCGGSAMAAPVMQAAPMKKLTPVSTATPTPAAAAAAAPPPPPAPAKKSAAPSSGLAWTTTTITLTGTGVAAPRAPFTPLAWTTSPIALTGTGSAPTRAPAGIAFTTDTIKVTGRP